MKNKHNFDLIYRHAMDKLKKGLDAGLSYHNAAHTEWVVQRAAYIGAKEGASKKEIHILQIAALYHDAGFIIGRAGHEEIGCRMAEKDMTTFHYSKEDIEAVCSLIKATSRTKEPGNKLEKIILDADVEYIGTVHYDRISRGLYEELKKLDPDYDEMQWFETQINFLSRHIFYTRYCKIYREFRKRKQLEKIKADYALALKKKNK